MSKYKWHYAEEFQWPTWFEREMTSLLAQSGPSIPTGHFMDGKMYKGWADKSKSRVGVRYNRLLKLRHRLRGKYHDSHSTERQR